MIKLLKEYVRLMVEAPLKSSNQEKQPSAVTRYTVKQLAQILNSETKRERKAGKAGLLGIRYVGSLSSLQKEMEELGASMSGTQDPGEPFSLSGRYKTYLFSFDPSVAEVDTDGKIQKFVPIITVDPAGALLTGQSLGYGAEQAVYAALQDLDKDGMEENILADSRLKEKLQKATDEDYASFIDKCSSMLLTMKDAMLEKSLSMTAEGNPPGGGNAPVDITAVDDDGLKYNVHVKYKSDRLVGLYLPKFPKDFDEKKKNEILQGHPNWVYRQVRDEFAELPNVQKLMKQQNTSEVNAIFSNEKLKRSFYAALEAQDFNEKILRNLKKYLGFESDDATTNTIFFNFLSPDNVSIQVVTSEQGENLDFSVNIPEDALISKALSVDATVTVGKGRSKARKMIQNVFDIEFGSKKRNRGLDVHKGENYAELIDVLQSL